ncbi:hypothetical protein MM213_04910 [Belliella sp. R4-6]|uniref:AhpC/TSA family protein n=1 Tax=Belliella alkalica TaxID=1730871 RepID=A0ABS9V8R3_9BACT|nr:hypothetical protein [Belliella alkalica]MCH7412816.1 hypothetical protein [Belliella alkalica]
MKSAFIVLFTILSIFSCSTNEEKIQSLSSNYMKQFPLMKDTAIKHFYEIEKVKGINEINSETGYKVIKLITTECAACFLEMEDWSSFISSKKLNSELEIYFIATGKRNDYFDHVMKNYNYPFTIYIDEKNSFIDLNNLNFYSRETFLLDSENKISLIGSPVANELVYDLYQLILTK